jgi:RHS repeat-associated protein
VRVEKRNEKNQGYNWTTIYDGLGRRLQTHYSDATGTQETSTPLKLTYYYDPEYEFLELGHDNFGRTWNLYGPDRSGTYGGAQGIGGLEATLLEASGQVHGVVNNFFGDSLGLTSDAGFSPWGNVLGGYGAMPGSSVNADLVPQWRGRYLDWTGFYSMGARYYEPKSGRFLSPDPLGHDASLSLYDYCNGDPVNGLDPDGRCVENVSYSLEKARSESDFDIQFRIYCGIPISILSGDAFYHYTTPEERMNDYGFMPTGFSINGIFTGEYDALRMGDKISNRLNISSKSVFVIENPTRGPLDIVRAAGQQVRAIDITALRAADMIRASGGGYIIAHSNGSGVFFAASALLPAAVKANINYEGFGPQININEQNVPGLRSYYNEAGSKDWIARGLNHGAYWDKEIPQKGIRLDINHSFPRTYAPDVHLLK